MLTTVNNLLLVTLKLKTEYFGNKYAFYSKILPEILLNTEILQDILKVSYSFEKETGGLHQPSTETLLRAVFTAPHSSEEETTLPAGKGVSCLLVQRGVSRTANTEE